MSLNADIDNIIMGPLTNNQKLFEAYRLEALVSYHS